MKKKLLSFMYFIMTLMLIMYCKNKDVGPVKKIASNPLYQLNTHQ